MANYAWFGRAHRRVFEWTGGRIGGNLGGVPMLLLTTTGRRSGEARTTPLAYMPDGPRFVVFASNNGQERPPAWWLNLEASPQAAVRAGRRRVEVTARVAEGEEREALWPRMLEVNSLWERYPKRTMRPIPVVLLEPS